MKLTKEQDKQLRKQLKHHQHESYQVDIKLAPGFTIKNFLVHQGFYRSDVMCTSFVAQWLFYNNKKYQNKQVFDLGCGTGLIGIVAGLFGANHVVFSDISREIVANALVNIKKYGLENKATIVESDLFANIKEKADVVIFNHPLFPDDPIPEVPVSYSMLGGEKLIHKFLEDVKCHLKPNGIVIMPFLHLAGETNNPAIQGPKHGFRVTEMFNGNLRKGLQQGPFSIYELTRWNK